MILDATNRKIQVVLAGATTTNQLPIVASWVDLGALPGSSNLLTNSTTAVDVIAAPASGVQRIVQNLTVYNKDTASAVVTVIYNAGGTSRELVKITLAPGETLVYTAIDGWTVATSNVHALDIGSFSANKNGVDQTGVAATTYTKMSFTTEAYDVGGYYDTSTSRWTPPAGPVLITGSANYKTNLAIDALLGLSVYKNGAALKTTVAYAWLAVGTQTLTVAVPDIANGSDYYELYCLIGGPAGTKDVNGAILYTWFAGTCFKGG